MAVLQVSQGDPIVVINDLHVGDGRLVVTKVSVLMGIVRIDEGG